ncbi:unnamed protein product [Linum trigynum]|uniref:F-box domain-containing protein n=1 Tax=Linum trigynum TaxID=586398 RepID=A0AAV2GBY7_9ROSI
MKMDYSHLPEDIVVKIASDHFEMPSQLVTFSVVCKFWRSIALRPRNYKYAALCPVFQASSSPMRAPTAMTFLPSSCSTRLLLLRLTTYFPIKYSPLVHHHLLHLHEEASSCRE